MNNMLILLHTVDGSLSQKASRHMLQASSQASWIPPSTKATAEVRCPSDVVVSPAPWKFNHQISKFQSVDEKIKRNGNNSTRKLIIRKWIRVPKKTRAFSEELNAITPNQIEIEADMRSYSFLRTTKFNGIRFECFWAEMKFKRKP